MLLLPSLALSSQCWLHDNPKAIGSKCTNGCTRSAVTNNWITEEVGRKTSFEYVWQPWSCDLHLYSDDDLKKCVEEKVRRGEERTA